MNRTTARELSRGKCAGMTLVEMMVVVALGSIILAAASSLWLFGSRSFVAMGNYQDLDGKSRTALDLMSRDLRGATQVTAYQSSATVKSLTVTNAVLGTGVTYVWDARPRTLVCQKTGEADQVYLTECDRWDCQLYQRAPHTNGSYLFFPATNTAGVYDLSICKLINMTWKCSRTILGSKVNTESVQTAQVMLRNKVH
jgi:prepilin-type N-terminal cleavage/methylation domain-containing protein